MRTIGEELSEARTKIGLTLKEAENGTKIRAKYLRALEKNEFHLLPGEVYARGFIKAYADFLGIDSLPLVEEYKNKYGKKTPYEVAPVSQQEKTSLKGRRGTLFTITTSLLLITLFGTITWIAFSLYQKPKSTTRDKKIQSSQKELNQSRERSVPEETPLKPQAPPTPNSSRLKIKIEIIEIPGSWVKVAVDGKKAYEGIIKDGEVKEWSADQSIVIKAGNPQAIRLYRNGKDIGIMSHEDGIIEREFKKGEE